MSYQCGATPTLPIGASFLGVVLSVLVAACLALAAPVSAQDAADRIWSGGPIITMNDKAMRAEAVAEKGGKIVAVGSKASVMKLRGPKTEMFDLKGRTMLPGFVDAHGHMMVGGIQALSANLLAPPDGNVKDIASLQKVVREWMAANEAAVKKVNLILGFGYDNATLAEHRHPTRDDLDQISKDVPIMLWHQSGHMVGVNSKALEISGMTADTPDPEGGVIRRRAGSKEPDGVFEETAMMPVLAKLLGSVGAEGGKQFVRAGAELWARFGYTTAQEGRSVPATAALMRQVADEGGYKIDVVDVSGCSHRARLHQEQRQRELQEPLPRRGRQAHHRRLAAGLYRLARPAVRRTGRRLPEGLRGLCCRDARAGASTRSTGLMRTTSSCSRTPMARPPPTC